PDFRLRVGADALTVPRGGQAKLTVQADRAGGFAGPIALTLDGLPPGVTVKGALIPAKQNTAAVVLAADAKAPVRAARLTLYGSAHLGGKSATRTATLPAPRGVMPVDSLLLAVALPTPFKIVGEY